MIAFVKSTVADFRGVRGDMSEVVWYTWKRQKGTETALIPF
jgi:hypothetical protein